MTYEVGGGVASKFSEWIREVYLIVVGEESIKTLWKGNSLNFFWENYWLCCKFGE